MPEQVKNTVKVASVYAASIIGAGFASGQEILQFFTAYRTGGYLGVLMAGLLFAVIGVLVLERVRRDRIRNFEEYLFPIFGWKVGWVLEFTVTLFMFCLYCIMLAGAGGILTEKTGLPFRSAVLVMGLVSAAIILTSIRGIAIFSTFLTPVLIIGILLAGIYILYCKGAETVMITSVLGRLTGNWFFSSLLYVSYNSILAIAMLCSLLPYLKTPATARMGGILGGVLLCAAALLIHSALFLFSPQAATAEMPLLEILKSISDPAGSLYAVILWIAMLLSSVTSGFCFVDRTVTGTRLDRRLLLLLLLLLAVPMSTLGFSALIRSIYPVFGYIGLFMVLVILFQGAAGFTRRVGRKRNRVLK